MHDITSMIYIPLELTLTIAFPLTIRPISGTNHLSTSVSNFSSSKYTIFHMKYDLSPSLLHQSSQLTQPLLFIFTLSSHLTQIDEINYLHIISIIGIIGN